MNKKLYIIPTLMLTLAVPAGAHLFKVSGTPDADGTLQGREKTVDYTFKKASAKKTDAIAKTIGYVGDAAGEVEKLGTLKLLFEEDFSKMSTGSIEEPDTDIELCIPFDSNEYTYPWWNLKPQFTNAPHWGAGAEDPGKCGAAGGCYYMEMAQTPMGGSTQAHINTPLIKADEDGATAIFEFKARTKNAGETYDGLLVELAETNDMGPTWRYPDETVLIQDIPAEWTTYRVLFRDCGPTTLFHLVGVLPGNVYIDDIKIYQLIPNVMYPTTLPHTDYKGESFTANWTAVEGADSYLLNVYSLNDDGTPDYLLKDQAATTNSFNVTGAESGELYYYTVRSVKDGKESVESFPTRVYALVAPTMKEAQKINGWTYRAMWNDVPGADVYNYMAWAKRVATEDGPFIVTYEDFTGITDFDGFKTGLTKEDPSPESISGKFYPTTLNQQGWYGESAMPYDDYIAFDAFHYETGGGQAGFISPGLDLSKDGGKFTIECDLAAETDAMGNVTSCVVGIFNWNDVKGDYDQVELIYVEEPLSIDWARFQFTSDKGTENTAIGIFAISSFGNLYLDNLKVTQNYKAGEYLMDPFQYTRWHGRNETDIPSEIEVEVAPRVQGLDIYHQVSAFSRMADERNQVYDDRESPMSELTFVMTSISGVEDIVSDAVEAAPEYFSIDGKQISAKELTPGLYVVRRGSKVTKEVIK